MHSWILFPILIVSIIKLFPFWGWHVFLCFQMNYTRDTWSREYACTRPQTDLISVVALTCFFGFIPFVFYVAVTINGQVKNKRMEIKGKQWRKIVQYCSKVLLRNLIILQRDFLNFRDFCCISSNLCHSKFSLKSFAKLRSKSCRLCVHIMRGASMQHVIE